MTQRVSLWSIYLVRCREGELYTGIATDVERRFEAHVAGRGAKFLRGRGPLRLVFQHEVGDRSEAQRVEYRLKQWPRAEKLLLAGRSRRRKTLLAQLLATD